MRAGTPPSFWKRWLAERKQRRRIARWERKGKPLPPPHAVKRRALRRYAERFGLTTLVETGTYYGHMIEAIKHDFERVYSIELSEALHAKARQRFAADTHVQLIQGDSGVELGKLCATLDSPTLFWLDGHYSSGETAHGEKATPIYEELGHIFGSGLEASAIVIDDARLFGSDPGYPTIQEVTDFIKTHKPELVVEVKEDSIRAALSHPV